MTTGIIIALSGIGAHFARLKEEFGGLECMLARGNFNSYKYALSSYLSFIKLKRQDFVICKRSRDCSDCFVVISLSFYFLSALQSDAYSNTIFLVMNVFRGPFSELILTPAARPKLSLSQVKKLLLASINSLMLL